jgi:lysophospholipase L1-like esterase
MAQLVRDGGKLPILFNVPHANEWMFPTRMATEIHSKRDYHNPRLKAFCNEHDIPLADICSPLRAEHLGDALHPNDQGARIIAEAVFQVLPKE